MNFVTRASVLMLLVAAPLCCDADDCFADEVEAHGELDRIFLPCSRV